MDWMWASTTLRVRLVIKTTLASGFASDCPSMSTSTSRDRGEAERPLVDILFNGWLSTVEVVEVESRHDHRDTV
jgi:hypothetical protein